MQSFRSLPQKPLSVDLTVEEGQRLKVIYGSVSGFHAIDVDSGTPYDLYLPTHVSKNNIISRYTNIASFIFSIQKEQAVHRPITSGLQYFPLFQQN